MIKYGGLAVYGTLEKVSYLFSLLSYYNGGMSWRSILNHMPIGNLTETELQIRFNGLVIACHKPREDQYKVIIITGYDKYKFLDMDEIPLDEQITIFKRLKLSGFVTFENDEEDTFFIQEQLDYLEQTNLTPEFKVGG